MSDEFSEPQTIASTRRVETVAELVVPFHSRWADALAGDRAALGELAADCWAPIYAWLRAHGGTAGETVQRVKIFPTWLQTAAPPCAEDAEFARFSDFLLVRLAAYAEAGFPPLEPVVAVAVDEARAERKFAADGERPPAEMFSRRWSMMILEWTLVTLRQELETDGKGAHFVHLKGFLNFSGNSEERYAAITPLIGLSSSALHVAVFRFRQRYRELLRHWISDTVRAAGDVDGELTMLLCAAS